MGHTPAVVIIARHGARLDAADKQWHLTSPTPYDPPLTYGGWTQSRALGARIASILQTREAALQDHHGANGHMRKTSAADTDGVNGVKRDHARRRQHNGKRRRHKVIIHTSPFLRCVQTSIAISAGMSQYRGLSQAETRTSKAKPQQLHSGSPYLHASDPRNTSHLAAILEPGEEASGSGGELQNTHAAKSKSILRVDAFLGEWLSPDYYDTITPPPGSVMMVAGAKADLLRRGEPVDNLQGSALSASQGNFPGGWGSGWSGFGSTVAAEKVDLSVPDLSNLSIRPSIPKRNRATTYASAESTITKASLKKLDTAAVSDHNAYVPPTPSYAISPLDAIPPGYVAHARDACVDVDFQWDSMREPLEWGNGGEYGEEWSKMHKRFRKGLQNMVMWYRTHDLPQTPSGSPGTQSAQQFPNGSNDDDDDTDTVLILVTHGAGCNALIGALTNQPVLLDVGMASLTLAVRRDGANQNSSHEEDPRRKSSIDLGISDDYEVRLVASTEHLRAGSNPLTVPQLQGQSPRISSPALSAYRNRYHSVGANTVGPLDRGFSLGEPALSGVSRSGSSGGLQRNGSSEKSKSGLWSKPTNTAAEDADFHGSGNWANDIKVAVNTSNGTHSPHGMDGTEDKLENKKTIPDIPTEDVLPILNSAMGRPNHHRGLWGATPRPSITDREKGAKRRWSVDEQRTP
ncbi:Histidine phosphatase superfamily, clade-1 [Lasallia pustulata]|uniref:Histidine phosphatase superfamily, clade-1 n=1 Tax=Lasallia pustulata TaxID=136370 RepID=A0A1W5D8K6_9LECA|nr:Histidine phosphatase superfamily, clade-1 [Lasallia pustulata]